MKINILCTLILAVLLLGIQSASAAPQNSIDNITDTAQQTLNNASVAANQTAQEVNNFLDPIQNILNSINSVLQQIQQIMSFFNGGQ